MIWLVTVILLVTIVLLVTEAIPVDLTALMLMVVLMVTGALTPSEALAGLAHPAPVTVGALFIVSAGLGRTGALDLLALRLTEATRGRPRLLLLFVLLLGGVLSAFVNNTPVVVLLISVLISASGRQPLVLSKYLMPLSFISILAGTSTLIGTSTNIIVSDLAVQLGEPPLGIFELGAVGAPLAIIGGLFLYLFAFRLLPAHKTPVYSNGRETTSYLSELLVSPESPLVGSQVVDGTCAAATGLEVYEVLRGMTVLDPFKRPVTLRGGDLLLAKAVTKDLIQLLDRGAVRLPAGGDGIAAAPFDEGSLIVELVVPPNSSFAGRRWRESTLAAEPHIHCLGVQRSWTHYTRQKLADLRLAVGDILLVQSPKDHLEQLRAGGELMVFEDLQHRIVNNRKAPLAVSIFLAMVALASTGVVDILVAAMGAATLMVALGCISLQQAYRSIDVKTLLLIAGTLALGQALQKSGAAEVYARALLLQFASAGPHALLAICIGLTSLLSHFLSNNSTAVLMTPVALSAARALGVATRPFIVGLCLGASACFATPIGYQTNLLVYGPGGYRFSDYLKLGIPLDLLVCVGAALLIPVFWPFG